MVQRQAAFLKEPYLEREQAGSATEWSAAYLANAWRQCWISEEVSGGRSASPATLGWQIIGLLYA